MRLMKILITLAIALTLCAAPALAEKSAAELAQYYYNSNEHMNEIWNYVGKSDEYSKSVVREFYKLVHESFAPTSLTEIIFMTPSTLNEANVVAQNPFLWGHTPEEILSVVGATSELGDSSVSIALLGGLAVVMGAGTIFAHKKRVSVR